MAELRKGKTEIWGFDREHEASWRSFGRGRPRRGESPSLRITCENRYSNMAELRKGKTEIWGFDREHEASWRSFGRGRPRRVICYRVFSILERCPSGRRCTLGRRVCSREYRGFESPSLRTADTNCYNNMAVCALKRVESGDSNRKMESPSLRTYS